MSKNKDHNYKSRKTFKYQKATKCFLFLRSIVFSRSFVKTNQTWLIKLTQVRSRVYFGHNILISRIKWKFTTCFGGEYLSYICFKDSFQIDIQRVHSDWLILIKLFSTVPSVVLYSLKSNKWWLPDIDRFLQIGGQFLWR